MNINEIKEQADYCLSCKVKPCQKGCPLGNDITEFIKAIKIEDYKKAYEILLDTTVLSSVCGRICPHFKQCQGSCIRGIKGDAVSIGKLEAFIGDMAIKEGWEIDKLEDKKNRKVAVIGGGPAGITAAAYLARRGFEVTIYEKHEMIGGLLTHGIPDFRLPRDVVKNTTQKLLDLDVKVVLGKELGKDIELKELQEKYDAVLLTFGANISSMMHIEGENLERCIWPEMNF